MSSPKKQKTRATPPTEMHEYNNRTLHNDKMDMLSIVTHLIQKNRKHCKSIGLEFNVELTESGPLKEISISEKLNRVRNRERENDIVSVCDIMCKSGSAISKRNGVYEVVVPELGKEDITPYLRAVRDNEPGCKRGNACYTLMLTEWPREEIPRSLKIGNVQTDMCVLCHEFTVSEWVHKQQLVEGGDTLKVGKKTRSLKSSETGMQETQISGLPLVFNAFQHKIGEGGYKSQLQFIGHELMPIHGLVGSFICPSLGHYEVVIREGVPHIDDSSRHFCRPSV